MGCHITFLTIALLFSASAHAASNQYDTAAFWKRVSSNCDSQIGELGSCLADGTDLSTRNEAATRYAQCFRKVYLGYFSCAENNDGDFPIPQHPAPPLNITTNSTCSYPAPGQILESACTYDINTLGQCCGNDCSVQSSNVLLCQNQAAKQYVRCSQFPPSNGNTTGCVTENAEKATWLPAMFFIWSGAETCPKPDKILRTIALSNVIAVIVALLRYGLPLIWERKKQGHLFEKTTVAISGLGILVTVLLDAATPILVGVALQMNGNRISLVNQFLIWAVSPRVAPVIGLLGIIHPTFMEHAIGKIVADLLFSVPATVFALYAALLRHQTNNPARPEIFMIFRAGGIMMLVPAAIILLALFIMALNRCQPIRMLKYPVVDGYRSVHNLSIVRKLTKREKIPQREFHITQFKGWYWQFLIMSVILYIGGWMVWSSFLKMAGDLYCPASLKWVAAILLAMPPIEITLKSLITC